MIDYHLFCRIKHLYDQQGFNITQISKELSLDFRTVSYWISQDRFHPRKSINRPRKLDSFYEYIEYYISEDPFVSTEEIYKRLIKLGFHGSRNLIKGYLSGRRKHSRLQNKYVKYPFRSEEQNPEERQEIGYIWVLKLLQGAVERSELQNRFLGNIDINLIDKLYDVIIHKPIKYRNRAITVLLYLEGIPPYLISRFLFLDIRTVKNYIEQYDTVGAEKLLSKRNSGYKKHKDNLYIENLFKILHAPPSSYNINRTTWKMDDLHRIMSEKGLGLCKSGIRKIIKDAGYRFRKAKKVLTSNDPHYQEKLEKITSILSNLSPKEKFFSIDEFGPFAVKIQGGKSLTAPGKVKSFPQRQTSKGSLICTAALELSTNQVTHFYSEKKNTSEMIKLLDILVKEYKDEDRIYFSWDAASWHASKSLFKKVEKINHCQSRLDQKKPIIELVPLPSCAQFLNVIESVFSGMARAIIHNSDYQSVEECKAAIDRYFSERNQYFKENPKRAGNKIWGKERVAPKFSETNNCKDPAYR